MFSELAPWVSSLRLRAQLPGCMLDGLDDVDVSGAAAEIAGDGLADFELAGIVVLFEQGDAGEHHARRAIAALEAVLLPEAFLDRVELAVLQHRAGAAVGGVTADVRAGHGERLAQEMNQQEPRFDLRLVIAAVDLDVDLMVRHGQCSWAHWMARLSARPVRTRAICRLYSTAPRRSAFGVAIAAARSAASAIRSAVGCWPVRKPSASVARSGVGPALVRAMPILATEPSAARVT